MMKFALVLALIAMATLYKIYKDYEGDRKKAAIDVGLLLFLIGVTLFSRYLRIYLPLLVVHLLLLIIAWGSYYRYLFGKKLVLWGIFSPIVSIALFFLFGLFDRTLL